MIRLISTVIVVGICFSCVTNKKVQYLQFEDELKADSVVLDSVVRSYSLKKGPYRIQPQDLLSIQVESLTDEQFDYFSSENNENGNITEGNAAIMGELVDPMGEVDLPVIGKLKVEGLTVFEVQELVINKLGKSLVDPVVKVRLLNFRFTVLGEVRSEGTVISYNNQLSILEAIGLAGGLTDLAKRSEVKLLRTQGDRTDIQYINLLDEELLNSPYYYVHQNDVLIVPPLKQRPFKTNFASNLSLLLSATSTLLLVVTLFRL